MGVGDFNAKFGRVLLLTSMEHDHDHIENEITGVKVSNVDLVWYNSETNVCMEKLFQVYQGQRAWLQLQFSLKDKYGDNLKFCGRFSLLFRHARAHPQNTELLDESAGSTIMSIRPSEEKFVKNMRDAVRNFRGNASAIFCGICKDSLNSKLCHLLSTYGGAINDAMDSNKYNGKLRMLSKIEDNAEQAEALLGVAEQGLSLIRQEARSMCRDKDLSEGPFLSSLDKLIKNKNQEAINSINGRNQVDFRRVSTGGGEVALEGFAILQGIHVNQSIRDTFSFKTFVSLISAAFSLANDIISFKREFESGECCNTIYQLHVNQNVPLLEALQQSLDELNVLHELAVEAGARLVKLGKGDGNSAKYVEQGFALLQGYLQFYTCSSERYHLHDLSFDYIVQDFVFQ